jgi:hypothetical protein
VSGGYRGGAPRRRRRPAGAALPEVEGRPRRTGRLTAGPWWSTEACSAPGRAQRRQPARQRRQRRHNTARRPQRPAAPQGQRRDSRRPRCRPAPARTDGSHARPRRHTPCRTPNHRPRPQRHRLQNPLQRTPTPHHAAPRTMDKPHGRRLEQRQAALPLRLPHRVRARQPHRAPPQCLPPPGADRPHPRQVAPGCLALSPSALPHTIQALVDAEDDHHDEEQLARATEAKRIIADCRQRLARYRAAPPPA